MTVQRSKRPPRSAGLGRPRKLSTPPSAIGGPNVVLDLFKPADLQELANAMGLRPAPNGGGSRAASVVNEAFSNYANAAAMQVDDSPAGERRAWCAGIARAAAELRWALGHSGQEFGMTPTAFDGAGSLEKGWPADPQTPDAHTLQEVLALALPFAMPDKHGRPEAGNTEVVTSHDGMWNLFGRLNAGLHILALVAKAGEDAWGAETVRGRGSKDRGRRYLMQLLLRAFATLFEQEPTAAPGSDGFRWFSAVIARAGQAACEQRRLLDQEEPEQETAGERQARAAALRAIEAIAAHLAPPTYEMATNGTARMDHWIREARAVSGVRQAKAAVGPASPHLPDTRELKAESHK